MDVNRHVRHLIWLTGTQRDKAFKLNKVCRVPDEEDKKSILWILTRQENIRVCLQGTNDKILMTPDMEFVTKDGSWDKATVQFVHWHNIEDIDDLRKFAEKKNGMYISAKSLTYEHGKRDAETLVRENTFVKQSFGNDVLYAHNQQQEKDEFTGAFRACIAEVMQNDDELEPLSGEAAEFAEHENLMREYAYTKAVNPVKETNTANCSTWDCVKLGIVEEHVAQTFMDTRNKN